MSVADEMKCGCALLRYHAVGTFPSETLRVRHAGIITCGPKYGVSADEDLVRFIGVECTTYQCLAAFTFIVGYDGEGMSRVCRVVRNKACEISSMHTTYHGASVEKGFSNESDSAGTSSNITMVIQGRSTFLISFQFEP